MNQDSSGSVIDRIIAWLRGLFGAGKGAVDTTASDLRGTMRDRADGARDSVRDRAKETTSSLRDRAEGARDSFREGVDDAGQRARDAADRIPGFGGQRDTGGVAAGDRELPDLGDETDIAADTLDTGVASSFAAPAASGTAGAAPTDAAPGELTDDEVDLRSDFDDASGDWETGEETYPPAGSNIGSATHVHDAVGGEDELADDATDGIIDTTRDADRGIGGTEGYQGRDVSLQESLIVDEGASSDEFDGDEITPGDADTPYVTREDVEFAAEGYGDTTNTDLANTTDAGTSTLTGSTYTETDVVVPPAGTPGTSDADRQQASTDDASGFVATDAGADSAQGGQPDTGAPGQDVTGDASSFHVVDRYNYGMGDLGIGAGTTPDDAWSHDAETHETRLSDVTSGTGGDVSGTQESASSDTTGLTDAAANTDQGFQPRTFSTETGADIAAQPMGSGFAEGVDEVPEGAVSGTPGDVDASVSPDATRSEIESQSRGDAVNRSDEATQTPGFGAPETFGEVETGTTEPSRSATGDDLDTGQDALGTTLDFTEESDAFNEQAADLSGEDELAVSDENVSFGDRDEGVERVATFQSGTIAHEGPSGEPAAIDIEVTDEAYADLPDEPEHATADDAGGDDIAGSAYPSDRVVDTLDGDDFTDAEVPDVPDLDSSAGDLDVAATDVSEQVDYVGEPVERTVGDIGEHVDQDLVGTSDEHVGGEEPEFADEAASGTDETGVGDVSPEARAVDTSLAATDVTGDLGTSVDDVAGDNTSGATPGGSGRPVPAGAVAGDGGTDAPEGYPVKGNANSMIYHLPHFPSYGHTKAEYYFATEDDAIAAGYRAPGNVRRGGGGAGAAAASAAGAVADDTGAVTGDETSHAATGEVAFDQDAGAGQDVAGESPTGVAAEDTDTGDASGDDLPIGAVRGDGTADAPAGYPVKGNASSMIYHLPEFPSYAATKPEFCFATEQDALNAGYRAPANARRGGHDAGDAASSAASAAISGMDTDEVTPDAHATGDAVTSGSADTGDAGAGAEAEVEVPAGAVRSQGGTEAPEGYPVKGNASSMIYHLPSFPSYKSTKAEFYFATEEDAVKAGYRAPGKRNRGKKS